MGGYGSGRVFGKAPRLPVESCLALSADALTQAQVLRPDAFSIGPWPLQHPTTGHVICTMDVGIDTRTPCSLLRLRYDLVRTGEAMEYGVELTTTPTPWG